MNIKISYCLACFTLGMIILNPAAGQPAKEILNSSVSIASINPADENFSDLQPLKKYIGNSRVVVLGEISHDDGSSFQAKSRLVKFLHKEMGFDVLAWEAGMLDCWMMNKAFENNTPLDEAKTFFMKGGWDNSEFISPVFEYIRHTWSSSRPLYNAGFDVARPPKGAENILLIIKDIKSKLNTETIDQNWLFADSLIKAVCGYIGNSYSNAISESGVKKAERYLTVLHDSVNKKIEILKEEDSEMEHKRFFFQSLIYDTEIWKCMKYMSNRTWNLIRDNVMGERFNWILEKMYPGKKIIVWAATAHLIRNSHYITRPSGKTMNNFVYMGQYIHNLLKDDMYTIAFTTYGGERGMLFKEGDRRKNNEYKTKIEEPLSESYESFAHTTNKKFLFTDLKNQSRRSWLKNIFIARPLGYIQDKAKWSDVIDAFFFIDTMQPDQMILDQ